MKKSKMLIIRADASTQMGTGHVMRCLALAQAWQTDGGQVYFCTHKDFPVTLAQRLATEGINRLEIAPLPGSLADALETITCCQNYHSPWLVLDGYHFDASYQQTIKAAGLQLLVIDDYGHADSYCANFILNQNIDADASLYPRINPKTQFLLGCEYTLLRREFWSWRDHARYQLRKSPPGSSLRILVTLGGSDPDNVTLKVIQALQLVNSDNLEVIVVVGGSNPHYEKLQTEVAKSRILITLQQNVTNMPELMAWADIAIAAGGSTNWELAFMGLPSLVITVADNQKDITAKLDRQGVIINLGWHQNVTIEGLSLAIQDLIGDRPHRETMSKKGQQLVDGNGAKRVVSAMVSMLA